MQRNARKRGKRKQNAEERRETRAKKTKCRGTNGNADKRNKMKQKVEERTETRAKETQCRGTPGQTKRMQRKGVMKQNKIKPRQLQRKGIK
jgi:hypothetical protein